jgi:ribosomal protein L11 methyltransferase
VEWLQLHLVVPAARIAACEDALLASGALSVTLGEGGDRPVLEPGVGEMPLWSEVNLSALFDPATPRDPVVAALRPALDARSLAAARWEVLAERAWEREWLRHFAPLRCGTRLWVCPHGQALDAPGAVVLRLDPGLAFGTGTHPTTALCLEWLDAQPPQGLEVIDYGCGSGILGIAALLLGARHVRAVDIDPQALLATRDNAARNGLDATQLEAGAPGSLAGAADLLLANILAGPLAALAPRLATLTREGGHAVLSGILGAQATAVITAYAPWFEHTGTTLREDWCRIVLRRNTAAVAEA